jgi:hypothetical protein
VTWLPKQIEPGRLVSYQSEALQETSAEPLACPSLAGLAVLALLVLVAGLFLYARSTAALSWAPAPFGWGQPASASQVVALRDLPPYSLITPQDLATDVRLVQPGGITDQAEALGRFTLQEVSSGSVLLSDWLSVPVAEPSVEYALVSLPVARHMLALVSPGKPASFILAPREPGSDCQAGATPLEGIVLASQAEEESASIVVAIPSGQINALRLCLGFSDVVVVR